MQGRAGRSDGYAERLAYLFAPPGWSHDGSRKGSEALKADYVAQQPETAGMPGLPDAESLSGRRIAPAE